MDPSSRAQWSCVPFRREAQRPYLFSTRQLGCDWSYRKGFTICEWRKCSSPDLCEFSPCRASAAPCPQSVTETFITIPTQWSAPQSTRRISDQSSTTIRYRQRNEMERTKERRRKKERKREETKPGHLCSLMPSKGSQGLRTSVGKGGSSAHWGR